MRTTPNTPAEHDLYNYLVGVRMLRKDMRMPATFVYCGAEDFLLQHACFYTPRALPVGERKHIQYMRIKECFNNAYRMAREYRKTLHYVEGYALGSVLPVYHAWCTDAEGHVYDPTWCNVGTAYYGVEIPLDVLGETRRGGQWSVLQDYPHEFPYLRGVNILHPSPFVSR